MMHILINDVKLNVRIGNKTGKDIITKIRICQGDCLSSLLFFLYLAFALKARPRHHCAWRLLQKLNVSFRLIDCLRYAQSQSRSPVFRWHILFIISDENKINQVERIIPKMLEDEGLHINITKTGRYHVRKTSETNWKKCKYLGSLLETEHDI